LDNKIPWGYFDVDNGRYFPPEEYQFSHTEVDYQTGEEDIFNHSYGRQGEDYYNNHNYYDNFTYNIF